MMAFLAKAWAFIKSLPALLWAGLAFVGVWLYARSIKKALDAERSLREAEKAAYDRKLKEQEAADEAKKAAAAARKAAREKAAAEKAAAEAAAAERREEKAAEQELLEDAILRDAVEDDINRRILSGDLVRSGSVE